MNAPLDLNRIESECARGRGEMTVITKGELVQLLAELRSLRSKDAKVRELVEACVVERAICCDDPFNLRREDRLAMIAALEKAAERVDMALAALAKAGA